MSVLRTTTFDLTDGTGDYLEVEVSLTETDGEVEVEEITGVAGVHVHRCACSETYTMRTQWDLGGPGLGFYRDRIIADVESHFADAGAEIRAEEAAS